MITMLLIVGISFAVLLADKLGRIRLQIIGFIGCAVGLVLASLSVDVSGELKIILIFSGFMLFNFMTNLGPNAQTYLLAGEVFPTAIRGKGAGFAAAFAKIGAVATAFLFPILLVTLGTRLLLYGLVVASLLGAVVTWAYRIETTGVNLDRIGETEATSESGAHPKRSPEHLRTDFQDRAILPSCRSLGDLYGYDCPGIDWRPRRSQRTLGPDAARGVDRPRPELARL